MSRGGGGAEGGASWREEGGRRSAHARELEGTSTGARMSRGGGEAEGGGGGAEGAAEKMRGRESRGKREKEKKGDYSI